MQIKNRQQFLIIAAVAAVALLAGDRLVLSPLLKAWGKRATRITELQKQIAGGKLLLQREQSIRSRCRTAGLRFQPSRPSGNMTATIT